LEAFQTYGPLHHAKCAATHVQRDAMYVCTYAIAASAASRPDQVHSVIFVNRHQQDPGAIECYPTIQLMLYICDAALRRF